MYKVRVRYAPSPTGIPHIGNIRTALFNYLFAKNKGGQFILRIEDTDQNRLVEGAESAIKESLKTLGLEYDKEYQQSKRLDLYQKYLDELKKTGLAYSEEGAWRFKVTGGKNLKWQDAIHGEVSFSSNVIEDFIIVKSDGFPTYHFASVVDDHEMEISHVFRGDEWISSTPKHLLLYEAFSWQPPTFVHLPPILGPNKKKLSKREGAKSVLEYTKEGYLPEAIVNFLAFLGWSPKDERELFSLQELVKEFSLERVNKNSPVFNLEKLIWFNSEWIQRLEPPDLKQRLSIYLGQKYEEKTLEKTVPLVRERMKKLSDYHALCGFFYEPPITYEIDLKNFKDLIKISIENLSQIAWTLENISKSLEDIKNKTNVKMGDLAMALRVAISGKKISPPLNESIELLGKAETLNRLENAVKN